MTKKAQEAYIRGFCKVAEAYGVDPNQLIKAARRIAISPDEIRKTVRYVLGKPGTTLFNGNHLLSFDPGFAGKKGRELMQKALSSNGSNYSAPLIQRARIKDLIATLTTRKDHANVELTRLANRLGGQAGAPRPGDGVLELQKILEGIRSQSQSRIDRITKAYPQIAK